MTDRIDRRFVLKLSGAAAGLVLGGRAADAQRLPPPSSVDRGQVEGGKVTFPGWRGAADPKSPPPPAPMPPAERVGFAVVALGRLSLEEILPAFAECKKAKLAALVSGSPDKLRTVAAQYGVPADHCYDYAGFDRIRDDPTIKAVYIVLPNGMHREYVERAAKAGKHVLCEKPMANSAAEARSMIAACEQAKVKLMIAYRIQYEPYNQRARRFVQEGTFGRLVGATMTNTQTVAPTGAEQWRHKKALAGGGSLPDIGLYCVNTARFLTAEEPVEVYAEQFSPPGDPRYAEVEETVAWTMRFPSNFIAQCLTSYGARDDKSQKLNFATATLDMPGAYRYRGQQMFVAQNVGEMDERQQVNIPPRNQFAAEIDHMADCILQDRRPRTPGEEGLQDHVVMEAIYESARTGRPVKLKAYPGKDVFRGPPA
ncbi:Gfo/Idh/MocA family protein [Sphingomonas rubra]|uniref:Predicted dehydrogenase n=1 Tax=Sphingomonas rubra TaxID=634430 RepID=A0A1I5PW98_9SPHN|nr:Gfo/Idh/MocA family oxidoreductase [Sphingomonas rubra]SFP38373.1 Predicted dehydrogenase [Sphingomonas rubra]